MVKGLVMIWLQPRVLTFCLSAVLGLLVVAFPARAGVLKLTGNAVGDAFPQINLSGQVVWIAGDGQIFLWDGASIRQISHNQTFDLNPQINDAGWVVWVAWDGPDAGIHLWDGATDRLLSTNYARY